MFIMPDIVGGGLAFILSQVGARQLGGGKFITLRTGVCVHLTGAYILGEGKF